VHIVDTAGLRESHDPVERIGVDRAWQAISRADAVMLLVDARKPVDPADGAIFERLPAEVPRIVVFNKVDLTGAPAKVERRDGQTEVWLSAKRGEGIDSLKDALLALAGWEHPPEAAFLARERHLQALRSAAEHLERAAHETVRLELLAEELRLAHDRLCEITGEFTADDLLGEIFSRFCIGK
jgi:tRNA modification GTPase